MCMKTQQTNKVIVAWVLLFNSYNVSQHKHQWLMNEKLWFTPVVVDFISSSSSLSFEVT